MNNTLCLGVFLLVIYRQRLPWVWSSEVACIVGARRRAAGPAGGAPGGCQPAARHTPLWRLIGDEAAPVCAACMDRAAQPYTGSTRPERAA